MPFSVGPRNRWYELPEVEAQMLQSAGRIGNRGFDVVEDAVSERRQESQFEVVFSSTIPKTHNQPARFGPSGRVFTSQNGPTVYYTQEDPCIRLAIFRIAVSQPPLYLGHWKTLTDNVASIHRIRLSRVYDFSPDMKAVS